MRLFQRFAADARELADALTDARGGSTPSGGGAPSSTSDGTDRLAAGLQAIAARLDTIERTTTTTAGAVDGVRGALGELGASPAAVGDDRRTQLRKASR